MKKYEIVIQDDKGNTLQTIPAKHKTLTNKEAHKIIEAYKKKLENSCSNLLEDDIKAFDLAIKALRIVDVTENCFEHNRGEGLIDFDDWKDIKEFVEKAFSEEAENE